MVEMRVSRPDDMVSQKRIWKECFCDNDSYINFFFNNLQVPENSVVLLEDGKIASMAFGVPMRLVKPDGEALQLMYIYAFATDPGFRGNNYGSGLMDFMELHLKKSGYDAAAVVPGDEGLFGYYRRMGFRDAFVINETDIPFNMIKPGMCEKTGAQSVSGASAEEYNHVRNSILAGSTYVEYDTNTLNYQKGLSINSGADIYLLHINGVIGCAAVEKADSYRVTVKELLLPEEYIMTGLSLTAGILPAERYTIRRPAGVARCSDDGAIADKDADEVRGTNAVSYTRAFGMIKVIKDKNAASLLTDNAYLAFAFD